MEVENPVMVAMMSMDPLLIHVTNWSVRVSTLFISCQEGSIVRSLLKSLAGAPTGSEAANTIHRASLSRGQWKELSEHQASENHKVLVLTTIQDGNPKPSKQG